MERRILHTLSGIGLAALLSSCGTKETVISPMAIGPAGTVAPLGTAPANLAGDTASRLANEGTSGTAAAPEPFSLRSGETLVNHTVASGDNLSGLSKKYGTRVSRIQAANNMTGTKIILGKTIKIPATENAIAAMAPDPTPERSAPIPPDPAPAPVAPAPAPAPAPANEFAGFGNPAISVDPPVAPAPAPAPAPVAPVPAPAPVAPAVEAPSGLPSFNSGLRIED